MMDGDKQRRFRIGDWVRVDDDLGDSMRHFKSGCEAMVLGSYAEQYGGDDHDSLTLYIRGSGRHSWYSSQNLTLLEANRTDILHQWQDEVADRNRLEGDLDWIFEHGEEVLRDGASGATVEALAKCLDDGGKWPKNGEPDALWILQKAKRYLLKGDKGGWLRYCGGGRKMKVAT